MNALNIEEIINKELDRAEEIWKEVGEHFILEEAERRLSNKTIPSKIPGFPFLQNDQPQVANFIALVLDIRESTQHLTIAISPKTSDASQLERVLYETTAMYAAGYHIINEYKGAITEFLGDGFLSLFKVADEAKPTEVYSAYNAAAKCLSTTKEIVNKILEERYRLPPLKIGIGLAYSKAVVTIVGVENNLHPKALGECVYRASKLSFGNNEIHIDDCLKNLWPKVSNGPIRFVSPTRALDFNGYRIEYNTKKS